MIRTDLYWQKINDLKTTLKEAGYSLDIDTARDELSSIEKELEKEEVYTDLAKSADYSRKAQAIRNKIEVLTRQKRQLTMPKKCYSLPKKKTTIALWQKLKKNSKLPKTILKKCAFKHF